MDGLTIMVSSIILSRYREGLDPGFVGRQKIAGGPLYPVEDILPLVEAETIIAWTSKCIKDLQKWSLDTEDMAELIKLAVTNGRYKDSQWCQQKPNGAWAACDAYTVIEERWNENTNQYQDTEFYLKFAIGKLGNVILTISCHP
jgi:hypothetical protein